MEALDRATAQHSDPAPLVDFPVLGAPGGRPLVDLGESGALLDLLDGVRPEGGESGGDGGGSHRSTPDPPGTSPPAEGSIARLVDDLRAGRAADGRQAR